MRYFHVFLYLLSKLCKMVCDLLWRDKSAVVENGLGYSEFVIDEELLSKIHLNSNLVNMRFLVISPVT